MYPHTLTPKTMPKQNAFNMQSNWSLYMPDLWDNWKIMRQDLNIAGHMKHEYWCWHPIEDELLAAQNYWLKRAADRCGVQTNCEPFVLCCMWSAAWCSIIIEQTIPFTIIWFCVFTVWFFSLLNHSNKFRFAFSTPFRLIERKVEKEKIKNARHIFTAFSIIWLFQSFFLFAH